MHYAGTKPRPRRWIHALRDLCARSWRQSGIPPAMLRWARQPRDDQSGTTSAAGCRAPRFPPRKFAAVAVMKRAASKRCVAGRGCADDSETRPLRCENRAGCAIHPRPARNRNPAKRNRGSGPKASRPAKRGDAGCGGPIPRQTGQAGWNAARSRVRERSSMVPLGCDWQGRKMGRLPSLKQRGKDPNCFREPEFRGVFPLSSHNARQLLALGNGKSADPLDWPCHA